MAASCALLSPTTIDPFTKINAINATMVSI